MVFLLLTGHYLSFEKDWSLILLLYIVVAMLMVVFLLFPALLGEPLFTRTREEWDDVFEREVIVDLPYQIAFDRCLGSVRLLMKDGRLDWTSPSISQLGSTSKEWITPSYPCLSPWPDTRLARYLWSDEGEILAEDREKGIIIVDSHQRLVPMFYPLEVPIRSTVTYTLKRLEHAQTQVQVRSTRTRGYGPAYGINRKYADAVCDFLLSERP